MSINYIGLLRIVSSLCYLWRQESVNGSWDFQRKLRDMVNTLSVGDR